MDVLLIANDFPNPWQPTRGIFNLRLASALASEHRVRVVAPIAWTDEFRARCLGAPPLNARRCRFVSGVEVHHPRYWYPPKMLRSGYGWFFRQSIRGTVNRILRQGRPEAVVGYWAHPDGEAAVCLARRLGVPSAVILGGSDVLLLPRDRRRRRCVMRVLRSADVLVSVSRHLKCKMIEMGIDGGKIHVWRQGVEDRWFHPRGRGESRGRLGVASDRPVVLWVGRMVPVKGLEVLLEACALLRGRGMVFSLCLVGDGPLRKTLAGEVARLRLEDTVHFAGAMRQEQLGDWYRAADLTVLPSRSEGLPNVLRESLACGTRFVASDVGGIAEIATGTSSRLVAPGDAGALADAMQAALADPAPTWLALRRLGTWADSARELIEILRPRTAPGELVASPDGRERA